MPYNVKPFRGHIDFDEQGGTIAARDVVEEYRSDTMRDSQTSRTDDELIRFSMSQYTNAARYTGLADYMQEQGFEEFRNSVPVNPAPDRAEAHLDYVDAAVTIGPQTEQFVKDIEDIFNAQPDGVNLEALKDYEPEDLAFLAYDYNARYPEQLSQILPFLGQLIDAQKTLRDEEERFYDKLLEEEYSNPSVSKVVRDVAMFPMKIASGAYLAKGGASLIERMLGRDAPPQTPGSRRAAMEAGMSPQRLEELRAEADRAVTLGFNLTNPMEYDIDKFVNEMVEDGDFWLWAEDTDWFTKGIEMDPSEYGLDTQEDWREFRDEAVRIWDEGTEEEKTRVKETLKAEVYRRFEAGQNFRDIEHRDNWFYRFYYDDWAGAGTELLVKFLGGAGGFYDGLTLGAVQGQQAFIGPATLEYWRGDEATRAQLLGNDTFTADAITELGSIMPESILWDGNQAYDAMKALEELEQIELMDQVKRGNQLDMVNYFNDPSPHGLEAQSPETYTTYMQMAGFDPRFAAEMFAAEHGPTAEEQLQEAVEIADGVESFAAHALEINGGDFALTQPLMALLSAYGKAGPMFLASTATALSYDEHYRDSILNAGNPWDMATAAWNVAEKNNFSPAQVVGAEGTFAGLSLDLGAGIVFDPFTYIFGPTAKAGSIPMTPARAATMARKGTGAVWTDDVVKLAKTGADEGYGAYRQLAWMGEHGRPVRKLIQEGADEDTLREAIFNASERALLDGRENDLLAKTARQIYTMRRWRDMLQGDSPERIARRLGDTELSTQRYIPLSDPDFDQKIIMAAESITDFGGNPDPALRQATVVRIQQIIDNHGQLQDAADQVTIGYNLQIEEVERALNALADWDGQSWGTLGQGDPGVREAVGRLLDEIDPDALSRMDVPMDEGFPLAPAMEQPTQPELFTGMGGADDLVDMDAPVRDLPASQPVDIPPPPEPSVPGMGRTPAGRRTYIYTEAMDRIDEAAEARMMSNEELLYHANRELTEWDMGGEGAFLDDPTRDSFALDTGDVYFGQHYRREVARRYLLGELEDIDIEEGLDLIQAQGWVDELVDFLGITDPEDVAIANLDDMTFEVSTRGEALGKRFSALNAHLRGRGGKSIEEIYQTEIKGYPSIQAGKGKPPLRKLAPEESRRLFDQLWREYLEENPQLALALWAEMTGDGKSIKILTDSFSTPNAVVSQADSLNRIMREIFNQGELAPKQFRPGNEALQARFISGLQKGADRWAIEVLERMGHDVGGFSPSISGLIDEDFAARIGATRYSNMRGSTTTGFRGEDGVNVGRTTSGGAVGTRSGEPFGNPFRVDDLNDPDQVARSVEQYREHLLSKIDESPEFKEDVADLAGKKLVCPARPHSPCHAEVLAEVAEDAAAELGRGGRTTSARKAYVERTMANVDEADVTIAFMPGGDAGFTQSLGTTGTVNYAMTGQWDSATSPNLARNFRQVADGVYVRFNGRRPVIVVTEEIGEEGTAWLRSVSADWRLNYAGPLPDRAVISPADYKALVIRTVQDTAPPGNLRRADELLPEPETQINPRNMTPDEVARRTEEISLAEGEDLGESLRNIEPDTEILRNELRFLLDADEIAEEDLVRIREKMVQAGYFELREMYEDMIDIEFDAEPEAFIEAIDSMKNTNEINLDRIDEMLDEAVRRNFETEEFRRMQLAEDPESMTRFEIEDPNGIIPRDLDADAPDIDEAPPGMDAFGDDPEAFGETDRFGIPEEDMDDLTRMDIEADIAEADDYYRRATAKDEGEQARMDQVESDRARDAAWREARENDPMVQRNRAAHSAHQRAVQRWVEIQEARRVALSDRKKFMKQRLEFQKNKLMSERDGHPVNQLAGGTFPDPAAPGGLRSVGNMAQQIEEVMQELYEETVFRSDMWKFTGTSSRKPGLGEYLFTDNDAPIVHQWASDWAEYRKWERNPENYPKPTNAHRLGEGYHPVTHGKPPTRPALEDGIQWDALNVGGKNPVARPVDPDLRVDPEDGQRMYLPRHAYERMTKDDIEAVMPDNFPGMDELEDLYASNSIVARRQSGVNLPAQPYLLALAKNPSRQQLLKLMKAQAMNFVYQGYRMMMTFWMADKLLGPRTAAVVAFDELFRLIKDEGMDELTPHVVAGTKMRLRRQMARFSRRISEGLETPEARQMLQEMDDAVAALTQVERGIDGLGAEGLETLSRENIGVMGRNAVNKQVFNDSVRQMISGNMNDTGFRAWLRGRDALEEWWNTSRDAQTMRSHGVWRFDEEGGKVRKTQLTLDDVDVMYKNSFPLLFNGKRTLSTGVHIRTALLKIADEADQGLPVRITDELLESVDHVRGVRAQQNTMKNTSDRLFQAFFEAPLNRRRSLVYRIESQRFRKQITDMYRAQGYRIMSDADIAEQLGIDLSGAVEVRRHLYKKIRDQEGIIAQGHLEEQVIRRTMDRINSTFYTWDAKSPTVGALSGVAPFAGPWAEMWKWWGQNVFMKPYVRKAFGGENGLIGRTMGQVPFDFRKFGTLSRLAATDFDLDQVSDEEAPVWANFGMASTLRGLGVGDMNLSSLFFLPTGGQNPAGTLFPQPGPLPLWAILAGINTIDDPADQESLQQAVANFIPFAGFGTGRTTKDLVNVTLGGGLLQRGVASAGDIGIMAGGPAREVGWNARNAVSWLTNDWTLQTQRNMNVRSALAEPGVMDELMGLDHTARQDRLEAITLQAERKTARQDMTANQMFSWFAPVSVAGNVAIDELNDVWIQAARAVPGIFEGMPEGTLNEKEKSFYAQSIRSAYFNDLTEEEQLMIQAKYPGVLVNLTGGWRWTDAARDAVGMQDFVSSPYRTGGTNEDRLMHLRFIDRGYIEPLTPQEFRDQVMVNAAAAREALARKLEEDVFGRMNDVLWEAFVSPATKAEIEAALSAENSLYAEIGITDPRDLWELSGKLATEDVEYAFKAWYMQNSENSENLDTQALEQVWDLVKDSQLLDIPTKERPISREYVGGQDLDSERANTPFRDSYMPYVNDWLPEYAPQAAEILGIELVEDLPLPTFIEEIVGIASTDQKLQQSTQFTAASGAAARWGRNREMSDELGQRRVDPRTVLEMPELIGQLNLFMAKDLYMEQKYARGEAPTGEERKQMRELYNRLKNIAPDLQEWDLIWEGAYRGRYGDLDFVLPEPPPPPVADDGTVAPWAWTPDKLQRIVDGDTIVIYNSGSTTQVHNRNLPIGLPRGNMAIRVVGADAPELSTKEGQQRKLQLQERLALAERNGERIHLVLDPELTGYYTDAYGRVLAWMYIGNELWSSGEDGFLPYTSQYYPEDDS